MGRAGGPFPSTDRNKNGNTVGALFAHAGGDAGDSASWRAGYRYDRLDSGTVSLGAHGARRY